MGRVIKRRVRDEKSGCNKKEEGRCRLSLTSRVIQSHTMETLYIGHRHFVPYSEVSLTQGLQVYFW